MIIFACTSPHPPLILPEVGSAKDRTLVSKTITQLQRLGRALAKLRPKRLIISSPHPDWGVNVPLHFLAAGLKMNDIRADCFITNEESPRNHYLAGKDFYLNELKNSNDKIALIASGDLSHRLKADGPYGLHPDGEKFDKGLIEALKNNDIERILGLEDQFPEAGECGLRSFCFALGALNAANISPQPQILSYENPFGVGYLVCDLIGNCKKNENHN